MQALQAGDDDGLTGRFLRTFGAPVVGDAPHDDAAQTFHDGSDEPWSETESSDVGAEAPAVIAHVFGAADPVEEHQWSEATVVEAAPAQADSAIGPDASSEVPHGEPTAFSVELSDAMHAVARAQRDRMLEEARQLEAACVDAARTRAADETERARSEADASSAEIEAWAVSEIQRIEAERGARLAIVRRTLDDRLARHDSLLEREVEAITVGARAHRDELEAFFSRLETERDPIAIASLAMRVPAPPRLDEIGNEARRRVMVRDTGEPAGEDGDEPAPSAATWDGAAPVWTSSGEQDRAWASDGPAWADPAPGPALSADPAREDDDPGQAADASTTEPPPLVEADVSAPLGAPPPSEQPAPSSSTKPSDLIFDRLRLIAERRATMGDSGTSGWATGSPTPFRR